MKKLVFLLLVSLSLQISAQELTLKKGAVVDNIKVGDSLPYSFSLLLPSNFTVNKKWPVVFIVDYNNKEKQVIRLMANIAEEKGYVLAASNNLNDTISISKNILAFSKTFNAVVGMLPIDENQIYTSGFNRAGRLASTIPAFISNIDGVLSYNSPVGNIEIINVKKPYQYIGIVSDYNFNYTEMIANKELLNKLKIPNQLLIEESTNNWPSTNNLSKALDLFKMSAMAKGNVAVDSLFINNNYNATLTTVNKLVASNKLKKAKNLVDRSIMVYKPFKKIDSLKDKSNELRKNKIFKSLKRAENNVWFKEQNLKNDYAYYIEEDAYTYNFNNLGWWAHQVEEIQKFKSGTNQEQQKMGHRLQGYLNALTDDYIDNALAVENIDFDSLSFLYMLKTIVAPKNYESYLKIISLSARNDDFGTSLFYLEELLKNGYTDADKLYNLESTTLLKLTPEYNQLIEKYLKKGRFILEEE
ncbi:MAG: alpha/beta hydrolase [Cellulophaga sp.]|uniref:alpha/beta hydrolase n=1 Tax=Cellulophaga sp. TaxID=1972202 RepID=UPI00326561C9